MTWLRWPRIAVDITARIDWIITPGSDIGGSFDETALVVVNSGAEAVTVRSIGLAMVKMPDGTEVEHPHVRLDYETIASLPEPSLPDGPALPTRIEAHDVKVWT